ncbi:MAG: SH3 domain-containing protein, partial [Tumebacillaceae bacterium]
DAVEWEAYFVRKQYLDASGQWYGGAPSLDGMNVHYASDPLWSEKIAGLMDSIRAYADADYKGKSPAQVTGGTPTGPLKEIVTQKLPTGALGVTLSGVDVYVMPASNSSQVIAHLQAGASLTVQGMQTDRWYQVQVGPQTGFVSVDSVKLTNVLKVNVSDGLNVRTQPSTSGSVVTVAPNGTLLLAKLDANGKPIVNNGWYQVTCNGATAYVSAQYVQQVTSL